MRYQAAEAYSMGAAERRREREQRQQQARPSFEVVSGGGLDARVRAGVSPVFVARVRAVVAVAAVLIVLGMARVSLSAATVTLLQSNSDLSAQISDTQTANEELMIERSVLSSNARITRIATQNYGMALPSGVVTLDLTEEAAEGEAAATDDAAETPANGEAAQTGAEASEQADVA